VEATPRAERPSRRVARRIFHVAVSLSVLYYWFPKRVVELGVSREEIAVAGVIALAVLEVLRLLKGKLVFPMREYERRQIGGHFWLVLGCAVALIFFEQRFVMLTILGTTLVDPLIGELRLRSFPRLAVVAGFLAWCAVATAAVAAASLATPFYLIPVGAAFAVGAEHRKIRYLDDNFLMNLVPLLVLTAVARVLSV